MVSCLVEEIWCTSDGSSWLDFWLRLLNLSDMDTTYFRSALHFGDSNKILVADSDCLASYANQASLDLFDTEISSDTDANGQPTHRKYTSHQSAFNNCQMYDVTGDDAQPTLVLVTIAPIFPDQELLVSYDSDNTSLNYTPSKIPNNTGLRFQHAITQIEARVKPSLHFKC